MRDEYTLRGIQVARKIEDPSLTVLNRKNNTISSVPIDSPDNHVTISFRFVFPDWLGCLGVATEFPFCMYVHRL